MIPTIFPDKYPSAVRYYLSTNNIEITLIFNSGAPQISGNYHIMMVSIDDSQVLASMERECDERNVLCNGINV